MGAATIAGVASYTSAETDERFLRILRDSSGITSWWEGTPKVWTVRCPYCYAAADSPCVTKSGRVAQDHHVARHEARDGVVPAGWLIVEEPL